jgi:UDP-N-acetylglucosamine/UDP-N-acetylgalactosamine diphosphorylase
VLQSLGADFERRGIRYIFTHQVDNPLVKMCDPAFVGFHVLRGSQFSSKAVAKRDPEEKVGVFCRAGKELRVVEYTELAKRERYARDDENRLRFRAGNIAQHVISVDFLCPPDGESSFLMRYHVTRKVTPHLRGGEVVEASEPNSVRFESFIFDAIPHARNPLVVEADREGEFAPLKNETGENSPESVRRAMMDQWADWLEDAGVPLPRDAEDNLAVEVEISALFAGSKEELKVRLDGQEIEVTDPLLLE